ncbi:MAG: hypothetical protein JST40_03155 [Armatimonadetes bacterium]|nr:hypothetical protein [Armatimonadota bacterium]
MSDGLIDFIGSVTDLSAAAGGIATAKRAEFNEDSSLNHARFTEAVIYW